MRRGTGDRERWRNKREEEEWKSVKRGKKKSRGKGKRRKILRERGNIRVFGERKTSLKRREGKQLIEDEGKSPWSMRGGKKGEKKSS